MRKVLPSLSALAALEAAIRTRSFVGAAHELNVTATAVSHQIIALEELWGNKLFIRRNRRVEPTEVAKTALAQLQEGLSMLTLAVDHIKKSTSDETVTICADHLFATKWLVARIGKFNRKFPHIRVNIQSSSRTVDTAHFRGLSVATLRRARVDLTVRLGTGHYAGMQVDRLFPVSLTPVCDPELLIAGPPLSKPSDLFAYPLIHDRTRYAADPPINWDLWFSSNGVRPELLTPGLSCGSHALAIEAAISGQGIALGAEPIVRDDIRRGRLIAPIAATLKTSFGYYLICSPDELRTPVLLLRDWIIAEHSLAE
ncbi:MAG: LysR family transcriptional regulator [Proteobacteria bacterium]|nr:LysR family transcriptional regulator [Pseudomonadota bacterium]